ncbi:MAG: hypothetical protein ACK56I_28240, partial [bacterium]
PGQQPVDGRQEGVAHALHPPRQPRERNRQPHAHVVGAVVVGRHQIAVAALPEEVQRDDRVVVAAVFGEHGLVGTQHAELARTELVAHHHPVLVLGRHAVGAELLVHLPRRGDDVAVGQHQRMQGHVVMRPDVHRVAAVDPGRPALQGLLAAIRWRLACHAHGVHPRAVGHEHQRVVADPLGVHVDHALDTRPGGQPPGFGVVDVDHGGVAVAHRGDGQVAVDRPALADEFRSVDHRESDLLVVGAHAGVERRAVHRRVADAVVQRRLDAIGAAVHDVGFFEAAEHERHVGE